MEKKIIIHDIGIEGKEENYITIYGFLFCLFFFFSHITPALYIEFFFFKYSE